MSIAEIQAKLDKTTEALRRVTGHDQSIETELDNQIEEMNRLESEWQRIKDGILHSEWMARRVSLLKKNTLTDSEKRELAELNQMCDKIPTGGIEDQELTRKLSHAVELLEKAAKSDPKGAGIPPAYLVPS